MSDQTPQPQSTTSKFTTQHNNTVLKSEKKYLLPLLLLIIIFQFLALIILGYTNLQLQQTATNIDSDSMQLAMPTENGSTLTETAAEKNSDQTVSWQTYVEPNNRFSVKHPSNWIVNDSSKFIDINQPGLKNTFQASITISFRGYVFESINPISWGPSACLYPDSPAFDGPSQLFTTFAEFTVEDTVYRRSKINSQTTDSSTWIVCSRKLTESTFGNVSGFGVTKYTTPTNADSDTLATMDEIFKSLQVLE